MRLKLLLTALLMLLPLPALADVTARYADPSGEKLVVMVDDGGNHRIEIAGFITLIRRDGVDYVVAKNGGGEPIVARTDALIAMLGAQFKSLGMPPIAKGGEKFVLIAGAPETVNGFAGNLWRFGPVKPDATEEQRERDLLDIVTSADPQLAPLGAAFRSTFELIAPVFDALFGDVGMGVTGRELFGKGAPLRIDRLKLSAFDASDVAATQFELPGVVLEPNDFFEAISPDAAAKALPPLP